MAYRAKYRYRWASQNGNQGEVLLLKDGYTGAVIDRPLGRAPELSMEQNGHIHGTSLVLYLECREDGEYTELYTSSAKEWQVQLWWNGRSLWTGYLTPELYSEPDIAPPYDVCVTATDGLGELKRSEYKPASWDLSLEDHLYGILALTGLDQTIYHTGGISADGRPGASMLHEVKVDLSHLQGKTCYDVLDGILTAINAELTTWGQQWMLLRPTDLDNESANLALYPANGGGSQTWSIPSYGSARTHGRWPVGQMSTQIIAARSAVTVQSPNHLREGSELSPDGWSGSGSTAIRVEAGATSASGELVTEGHWELMAGGSISQSVKYSKGLGAHTLSIDQYGLSKVRITYRTSSGSATHVLGMANGQVGWDMGGDILVGSKTRETLEIPIPAWSGAGALTVSIAQHNSVVSPITSVYGVSFAVNGVSYGLELRLDLSNGARSEADAVESAFSTYPGGQETYDVLLSQSGLPSFGGSPVSRWSTTKLGPQSYIGLLAMDIALGCALPRARKTGKLNVPQGADPDFLLLSDGSRNYFVNTYTVDLLEDEVSVDMVSLPVAELEVADETYSAMTDGSSASYGSGSPGSQSLPGYTVLSYDEAVALSEDPGNRTIPSAWALKTHVSDGVKHITTSERTKWNKVVSDFAAITGNDADSVINKWEEVIAFLDTYTEADTLANLLSNKVDKVSGKGLSTNDFTDSLLTKLNGIEAGANKYIHPTHSAVTIASADGRVLGSISVDTLGHVTSVGYKALGFADLPSLYIGKTKVQSSSAAQALTGISSITLEGSTAMLKWDGDKSAWRLSGNLLVDGFVASGGTIKSVSFSPFAIDRDSDSGASAIGYTRKGATLGFIGFNDATGPKWFNSAYAEHTILHSGNIKERLSDVNTATSWRFFYSTLNATNKPTGAREYITGVTFATDNNPDYQLQLGLDYDGNVFSRREAGGKWDNWKQLAFLTDNVASASKLQTSRTLWGQSFDGTGDVRGAMNQVHSIEFNYISSTSGHGGFIDFHYNGSTSEYTSRIIEDASGRLSLNSCLYVANGNVGIGTNQPSYKFHVNGNLGVTGAATLASLTLDGTNLLEWDSSNAAWKFNGNLIATGFIASGDISAQAAALAEEEDRIAALEAQVAELQAEIEILKAS